MNEIIKNLKKGNLVYSQKYLNADSSDQNFSIKKQEKHLSGQNPDTVVLSCSDSRVIPEFIFNKKQGELFTVRVAGNVASEQAIASIEYAITQLQSKVIVVLGHESCGAVQAAEAKDKSSSPHIEKLVNLIKPSLKDGKNLEEKIKNHAKLTAKNLVKNSSIIRQKQSCHSIKIVPAYYSLQTGLVEFLNF